MAESIKLSEKEYKKIVKNQKLFDIKYSIDKKGIYNYTLKGKVETKDNMTLNELAKIVNNLSNTVKESFKEVKDDIKTFKKDINTRLDGIDTRLDGIVKANNLKDPSKK